MSRALARQKLEAAISAMRCAQSNIDEAGSQLIGEPEEQLGRAACSLLAAGMEQFIRAAGDAAEAIRCGDFNAD